MKCARAQELFSSYMENTMEPPLRVAFEGHLAECADCNASYEKFNATMMMLEELPEVEVPASFHAAVMARVEQSKRVAPEPVKWWHLDWQHVFTVRVPARGLAMGMAVLLLMVMTMQLSPLHSITAGLLPSTTKGATTGINDANAPKIPSHNLGKQSGLSILVDTSAIGTAQNNYSLRFQADGREAIKFEVFILPAGTVTADAPGTPYYSGFVSDKQDVVLGIAGGQPTIMRVECKQSGREFKEYLFMPSQLSAAATSKDFSVDNVTTYDALRQLSEAYGVVILASGDLSKTVSTGSGVVKDRENALYDIVRPVGLNSHGVAPSVYMVEPGS